MTRKQLLARLKSLGFRQAVTSGSRRLPIVGGLDLGTVRLVLDCEVGHRLIQFSQRRAVLWAAEFDQQTPNEVLLATVQAAIGPSVERADGRRVRVTVPRS